MAPSHYLNQRWNIVNRTLGNKFQRNINRTSKILIQENALENVVLENGGQFPRTQCVKTSVYPHIGAPLVALLLHLVTSSPVYCNHCRILKKFARFHSRLTFWFFVFIYVIHILSVIWIPIHTGEVITLCWFCYLNPSFSIPFSPYLQWYCKLYPPLFLYANWRPRALLAQTHGWLALIY